MRCSRIAVGVAVFSICAVLSSGAGRSASPVAVQHDSAVAIAGRMLRCKSVRARLDRRLPNLGLAAPGLLVMNPALLGRYSETVQLFVFHHECGHHHVGASELGADCWAVKQGVRDGWLDRPGLAQVCKSFGNVPATRTHPAADRRCANLDRCFAAASATFAQRQRPEPAAAPAEGRASYSAPRLTSGPTLVRTGKGPSHQ